MAGKRYKIGTTPSPQGSSTKKGSSKLDLSKLLRTSEPKTSKVKTDTRGVTNPMMEDAASVLNTFYRGDPVLQGFLQMLQSARR